MGRDINDIQRDIERTRRQLAGTLDQIAERSKPQNLVNDAKDKAASKLQDPTVQKALLSIGAALAGLVVLGVVRGRKKNKDLKEIQKLLNSKK